LGLLFAAAPVAPGGADEVTIRRGNLDLGAELRMAPGRKPADGVILMVHGSLAHNGMEIMRVAQEQFALRGLNSLAITLGLNVTRRKGMYECARPHAHLNEDALDEIAAWLRWLEAKGTGPVTLLGHSRGANQVAWFMATRDRPIVRAGVLIAPSAWDTDRVGHRYAERYGTELEPLLDDAVAMMAEGRDRDMLRRVGFLQCPNAWVSAEAFYSYYRPDALMDAPTALARLEKPVMVIVGTEDTVVPSIAAAVENLDRPNVRLAVVDGADHFFRDLYAEDLADLVRDFLKD
jgi:pimeloyl-ACP methyl ester carboxylesterase